MKLLRKKQFIYTIKYDNKVYTFVSDRNLVQQKVWFDKVHSAVCRYENIKYVKIPQSKYTGNYIKYLFV